MVRMTGKEKKKLFLFLSAPKEPKLKKEEGPPEVRLIAG